MAKTVVSDTHLQRGRGRRRRRSTPCCARRLRPTSWSSTTTARTGQRTSSRVTASSAAGCTCSAGPRRTASARPTVPDSLGATPRYDAIVQMDADLSHPPERVPALLACARARGRGDRVPLVEAAECQLAARDAGQSPRRQPVRPTGPGHPRPRRDRRFQGLPAARPERSERESSPTVTASRSRTPGARAASGCASPRCRSPSPTARSALEDVQRHRPRSDAACAAWRWRELHTGRSPRRASPARDADVAA